MEYNFLSSWCIERIEKRDSRILKVIICIFLCFCVVASIKILCDFKLMKNKEEVLNRKVEIHSEQTIKDAHKYSTKNIEALNTLKHFSTEFPDNIEYNTLEVNWPNVNIELAIKDKNDYIEKIKIIESDKKCKIRSLSPIINDSDRNFFKVEIEVVK